MLYFTPTSFNSNTTLLQSIRQQLESIEVNNPKLARFLCKLIPASCPFAREIKIFQYTILRVPPLCKLNPLYEQVMELRFKCLSFLADECDEDITLYC